MSVTIRQLKIFNAVVESGQVTRAAQGLSITQSAVSLALNEMENQLGGRYSIGPAGLLSLMTGDGISSLSVGKY